MLGLKDVLAAKAPSEGYVLVKLEGPAPAQTRYFVVPRDHVAAAAWIVQRKLCRAKGLHTARRIRLGRRVCPRGRMQTELHRGGPLGPCDQLGSIRARVSQSL